MRFLIFIMLLPFLLPFRGGGQTRFYLTRLTPAITTIAPNSNWNVTTGNLVWLLNTYLDQSNAANAISGPTGAAGPVNMLDRQLVTLPLAAQTINGTLSMQQGFSSPNNATIKVLIYLRVINNGGSVASEIGSANSITFGSNAGANKTLTYTFSNLSITAGQRICVDLGFNYPSGSTTTVTGNANFAANNANTFLPVDNTTSAKLTDAVNPWIQFSQTLKFQNAHLGFF